MQMAHGRSKKEDRQSLAGRIRVVHVDENGDKRALFVYRMAATREGALEAFGRFTENGTDKVLPFERLVFASANDRELAGFGSAFFDQRCLIDPEKVRRVHAR